MTTQVSRPTVSEQLIGLAQRYAGARDVRRAQLASWAADVYVLEELLWENGLAEVPDPVAQLAAVGESVARALEELADGVAGDANPRAVVEEARRAMIATFDASVHEVLLEQLPSLAHLDDCEHGGGEPDRLAGQSVEEMVSELRQAARDCFHVREVMHVEGEETAADRMAHQSDVATFEAYLIAAAIRAGDHRLASVDLRWELARNLRPEEWSHVGEANAFATLRRELIALVGSAEMESLWRAFESTGEG